MLKPTNVRTGFFERHELDTKSSTRVTRLVCNSSSYLQARQESNLQPPVLETGALPIELRT